MRGGGGLQRSASANTESVYAPADTSSGRLGNRMRRLGVLPTFLNSGRLASMELRLVGRSSDECEIVSANNVACKTAAGIFRSLVPLKFSFHFFQ